MLVASSASYLVFISKIKTKPKHKFYYGLNRPVIIFKHVFKAKSNTTCHKSFKPLGPQNHHTKHLVNIFINTKIFFISFSKTKPYNTFPFCPTVQKQRFLSKPYNLTTCY
ncbi:hypothetical protein QL285_059444 [Trifolium repens]|nr:hypothetical protein QL285_059444 [Trifolium repens]